MDAQVFIIALSVMLGGLFIAVCYQGYQCYKMWRKDKDDKNKS